MPDDSVRTSQITSSDGETDVVTDTLKYFTRAPSSSRATRLPFS